ncbi:chemotaxis response regulator protein-glutamate methylesterase [Viridibacillus sp. YIM B01967]|uniref:Protein-glutamate methylesterase/protein-glutamine glutaminase n=2 Tax=Viridibacillus soli TaxID=2798301 RepID=A0ABS1H4Q6_9BACL|nr:chemotaxis response regulator protein-glutamate methylesterase [Viridibacillus soli]MBK3494370.1 chemotaxis response regulator protein-glutamate methylesterase [Viridibacillus soli]
MNISQQKKLLIVDDSAFMRKLISDFFTDNTKVQVVGTARNGNDALRKIKILKPDVVTMDIEMPEMNGLEALKKIMAESPVPVVMLSSMTERGANSTLDAMANGAVDFIAKPSGTISLDLHKVKEDLVFKVEQAANVQVSKLRNSSVKPSTAPTSIVTGQQSDTRFSTRRIPRIQRQERNTEMAVTNVKSEWSAQSKKMVLIGTSTGGPRALQEVLTRIPATIKAPILVVQHMPAGFTKSLSNRLNQLAKITVKEAENGDVLQDGVAYIAPGGYHMKLRKIGMTYGILLDDQEPPRGGHRPSVDVLFEDNSQFNEIDKVAVIMTGMGADGKKGLIQLKNTGKVIAITESANTCIVYGMPKAAFETGLVDEVADVDDIAETIMKYLP